MIPITNLRPFTRMLMTIGQIPTSYLISMTYEEQLLWLCNYLEKTVIPAIDNNAEAVKEVQELFTELKSYVDNYFDNLDVQEEINNKLDEMAESGQLADIIAQYLELAGVLAFDTISDMSSATNIDEGSICRTLGEANYLDGKGAFYKVRTITSEDVIDGVNIVALSVSNTLIAEKIPDYLSTQILNNTNSITEIKNKLYNNKSIIENDDYFLFIGDSYGNGYTPDGNVNSWCDKLANRLGINNRYYKFNSNGAGFVATGSGGLTFLQVLQNNINTVTNKSAIKKIIVVGGYNDANYNSSYSNMTSAIETFTTYCNTQFPNARVFIACVGYNANKTGAGADVRDKLIRNVIPAYMTTPNITNPCIYIPYSHLILHNSDLFSSDGFHPNENGQNTIANKLVSYILGGSINLSIPVTDLTIDLTSSGGHVNSNSGTQLWTNELSIINDKARFWFQENVNLIFPTSISIVGNQNFELGTYATKYLSASRNTSMQMPVKILIVSTAQGNNLRDGVLIFTTDGKVYLQVKQLTSGGSWETITNVTQISFYPRNVYFEREYN